MSQCVSACCSVPVWICWCRQCSHRMGLTRSHVTQFIGIVHICVIFRGHDSHIYDLTHVLRGSAYFQGADSAHLELALLIHMWHNFSIHMCTFFCGHDSCICAARQCCISKCQHRIGSTHSQSDMVITMWTCLVRNTMSHMLREAALSLKELMLKASRRDWEVYLSPRVCLVSRQPPSYVWQGWFVCVVWCVHMRDVICGAWLLYMRDMAHWCIVAWLSHVLWHDSFMYCRTPVTTHRHTIPRFGHIAIHAAGSTLLHVDMQSNRQPAGFGTLHTCN